jgi:hypothetical protein
MEEKLVEAKAKHIKRRNFALKVIGLSLVTGLIGASFNKVVPNNYFTCEVQAIQRYFEQRKFNPKIAEVTYYMLDTRCRNGE